MRQSRCLDRVVTAPDALRDQPVLRGSTVRLEPLTAAVLEGYLHGLQDPDVLRLTGTHGVYERDGIEDWLRTRKDHHDRADSAVLRVNDGVLLGEAVINNLDPDNGSASYRVWLAGPQALGNGYATETTKLIIRYAFDQVRVHRLALQVYEHNPRARRVYEKCGFTVEGRLREALFWQGGRYDSLLMSMLRTNPRPDS